MHNIFGIIERVKNKWLRFYRLKVFEWYTNQKTDNCQILGNMTLINKNVKVGKNVTFYPNVMLWGDGPVTIGDNVDIGINTVIYAKSERGGVTIGNNTSIAGNNYIIDSNHGTSANILINQQEMGSEPIFIGDDVWIAAGCQIIKGAKIGDGAIIGAGSLVNKEIPENTIAFGTPAKVYRKRE